MFRGTGHTSNIDVVKRRSLRSFRGRTFRELVAVFSGILARNASLGLGSHDDGEKNLLLAHLKTEGRSLVSTEVVRPIGDTAAPLVEVEFLMTVRCSLKLRDLPKSRWERFISRSPRSRSLLLLVDASGSLVSLFSTPDRLLSFVVLSSCQWGHGLSQRQCETRQCIPSRMPRPKPQYPAERTLGNYETPHLYAVCLLSEAGAYLNLHLESMYSSRVQNVNKTL